MARAIRFRFSFCKGILFQLSAKVSLYYGLSIRFCGVLHITIRTYKLARIKSVKPIEMLLDLADKFQAIQLTLWRTSAVPVNRSIYFKID